MDEVLADLKSGAPELFIEVPERPKGERVVAPIPLSQADPVKALDDLSFDEPVPVPGTKEIASKQVQQIISDTKWLTDHTNKSASYDDYGSVPTLDG